MTQMSLGDCINFQERNGELIACCSPVSGGQPLDLPTLGGWMAERGYGPWALLPEALEALVQRWNEGGSAFEQAVGRREDASLTVEVAADGLTAWLNLKAARGGRAPEPDAVARLLKQAGVVYGVDPSMVQAVCQSNADVRVVAALGVPAIRGDDARFELLVDDIRTREPRVDERGLIDYHELGDIPGVQPGQALMRRHPPTPGKVGCDVRGAPVHAQPGNDEGLDQPFIGVELARDDANLLLAAQAGLPVRTRCGAMVEKLLHLKGVNLATGNIHFVGSVEVAGDVSAGMKVQASGDIVIKGLVEGAHLEAGGSVLVVGGVIAHGAVRAAQSVSVRFVENSALHAGTTIAVENMALHSDLEALNQVLIGAQTGQRGRLVGGSTRATMLVRMHSLGAPAGGLTQVHVGVNPVLLARCQALDKDIEHEHVEADKLEKVVHHLEQHGDPKHLLDKVKAAWRQDLQAWGQLLGERAELDHQVALAQGARIEVLAGLQGDVDISFGRVIRHLRSSCGAGAFFLDDQGRVVFSAGHGKPDELV
jgi:uncharacterized protein (DUF342 family)